MGFSWGSNDNERVNNMRASESHENHATPPPMHKISHSFHPCIKSVFLYVTLCPPAPLGSTYVPVNLNRLVFTYSAYVQDGP